FDTANMVSKNCHVDFQQHRGQRIVVESLVVLVGVTLLLLICAADQAWVDRHFLPDFFSLHRTIILYTRIGRALAVGVALVLVFAVRPKVGRWAGAFPLPRLLTDAASVLLAVALALLANEFLLRRISPRAKMERPPTEEPR